MMRHDRGLAASPLARYILKVGEENPFLSFSAFYGRSLHKVRLLGISKRGNTYLRKLLNRGTRERIGDYARVGESMRAGFPGC